MAPHADAMSLISVQKHRNVYRRLNHYLNIHFSVGDRITGEKDANCS